jgi:hypothetical protein
MRGFVGGILVLGMLAGCGAPGPGARAQVEEASPLNTTSDVLPAPPSRTITGPEGNIFACANASGAICVQR